MNSSFGIIVHLPAKQGRKAPVKNDTDPACLFSSNELAKMVLKRYDFVNDETPQGI